MPPGEKSSAPGGTKDPIATTRRKFPVSCYVRCCSGPRLTLPFQVGISGMTAWKRQGMSVPARVITMENQGRGPQHLHHLDLYKARAKL